MFYELLMVTIRSSQISFAIIVGLKTLYSKVIEEQSLFKVYIMCHNFLRLIKAMLYYLYGHLKHAKQ